MELEAKIVSFSSFVNVCVTLSVYWGMLKAKLYNDTKELNRSDVGAKMWKKPHVTIVMCIMICLLVLMAFGNPFWHGKLIPYWFVFVFS